MGRQVARRLGGVEAIDGDGIDAVACESERLDRPEEPGSQNLLVVLRYACTDG
jgi:hypothetical protein